MSVEEPFVNPGRCSMPDCEVTLKFHADESNLYVCKHALVNLGDYFKAMFFGEFKEKNKNEIQIHDVSRSDMLLFLQFAVPIEKYECPEPSGINELYTLISLADRFLYPKLCEHIIAHLSEWIESWFPTAEELAHLFSLGDRLLSSDLNQAIAEDIVGTGQLYSRKAEFKLAIVEAAYKHRESSTVILEACIRLCANLEIEDVAQLQGKGMDGVMLAIYATIGKATPKMSDAPKHSSHVFDGRRVIIKNNVKQWSWVCSECGKKFDRDATMPLEKVMRIEIEKSLLV